MNTATSAASFSATSVASVDSNASSAACAPEFGFAYPGLLTTGPSRKAFHAAWKTYVANASLFEGKHPGPSARDMAVYCLLLGKSLEKAFSPISNRVKLANNQQPFEGLQSALAGLAYAHRGVNLDELLTQLGLPASLKTPLVAEAKSFSARS